MRLLENYGVTVKLRNKFVFLHFICEIDKISKYVNEICGEEGCVILPWKCLGQLEVEEGREEGK